MSLCPAAEKTAGSSQEYLSCLISTPTATDTDTEAMLNFLHAKAKLLSEYLTALQEAHSGPTSSSQLKAHESLSS